MIFYLIQIASACYTITDSINIYPTVNERFEMPLQQLFKDQGLKYFCGIDCPENVTIFNVANLISTQNLEEPQKIESFNSNGTHFVMIGDNIVALYKYNQSDNQMTLQFADKIESAICKGSLFIDTHILLDCYDSDKQILYFNILKDSGLQTLQIFYNQTSFYQTKMLKFQKGSALYLIYYNNWRLTLFRYQNDSLVNITTFKDDNIQDLDVSSQYIYIVSSNVIYQLTINDDNQIVQLFQFRSDEFYFEKIKVTNFYFFESQCDILAVQSWGYVVFFKALEKSIVSLNKYFQAFGDLLLSDQFVVINNNGNIIVQEIRTLFLETIQKFQIFHQETKLLYLNPRTSFLFGIIKDSFLQIFSIKVPQIQIYINNVINYEFILRGIYHYNESDDYVDYTQYEPKKCEIKVLMTMIDAIDKQVYLNFNEQNFFFNSLLTHPFQWQLNNVAGPLLNATGMLSDPFLGRFKDVTFEIFSFKFNQTFQVTNMFSFPNNLRNTESLFFAGAIAGEIYFYICTDYTKCDKIYNDSNNISITQIQISYNYEGFFLVGIDQGMQNITIYQLNMSLSLDFVQKQNLSFQNYKQFFLMYDKIVLLLQNNEIQIYSLITFDSFNINEQEINKLFSNQQQEQFQFTPINIEMDQAQQSSILFINNNNSCIIVAVQNINVIIPLSIVQVNYSIYQLNIINYQLILSYICGQDICFDVWNVENILNPYYVKGLPNILMNDGWSIQSDNLFLYILGQNSTVFIYNSFLSYHSSLYYELQIIGNQFSSFKVGTYSIISYQNQLSKLNAVIIQEFQYNESNTKSLGTYISQSYFNFSVSNKYSAQNQTKNTLLSLINPFTKINFNNAEIDFKFSLYENISINLLQNKQIEGQAQIQNYSISSTKNCHVQNYIEKAVIPKTIESISNWSKLLIINQTLILQNGLAFFPLSTSIENNNISISIQNQITINNLPQESIDSAYCNSTSFYNETVGSQMCQIFMNNTYQWFYFYFEFVCLGVNDCSIQNQIIQNEIQFGNIFKHAFANNQTLFILGTSTKSSIPQIWQLIYDYDHYNTFKTSTCSTGVSDFAFAQIENHTSGILFYICENKLVYSGEVHYTQVTLLLDNNKYIQTEESQLNSITILKNNNRSTLSLLITTNNALSYIIIANYIISEQDGGRLNITITGFQIVKTIPPFTNELFQTWEQSGLILMRYQNEKRQIFGIYDCKSTNDSLTKPLIMNGGIEKEGKLNSIALNLSEYGGQIYYIIDGKLEAFLVSSSAYLHCSLKKKQDYNLTITAQNYLTNGTFQVNFKYNTEKSWVIGLIVFVAIVVIIAIFFYWYKTKNIVEKESFLEEIELNE